MEASLSPRCYRLCERDRLAGIPAPPLAGMGPGRKASLPSLPHAFLPEGETKVQPGRPCRVPRAALALPPCHTHPRLGDQDSSLLDLLVHSSTPGPCWLSLETAPPRGFLLGFSTGLRSRPKAPCTLGRHPATPRASTQAPALGLQPSNSSSRVVHRTQGWRHSEAGQKRRT